MPEIGEKKKRKKTAVDYGGGRKGILVAIRRGDGHVMGVPKKSRGIGFGTRNFGDREKAAEKASWGPCRKRGKSVGTFKLAGLNSYQKARGGFNLEKPTRPRVLQDREPYEFGGGKLEVKKVDNFEGGG